MKNSDHPLTIDECIASLEHTRGSHALDKYEGRAFRFLIERLSQIKQEIATGTATRNIDLKGIIARTVVEQNPSVLTPELGGKLIAIEKQYYDHG
ncbi:hypothetical protein ACFQ0F_06065 [Paraperlucidibaca wandonensis]|uniref:Tsi6 domain-containing protein n=1 Tax=Paraperlucidibaca wandonensis TaxID=1268273 RepID=A0ABW3HI04_9GAMM